MSKKTLSQIKIFSAAAGFYARRDFTFAIRDFSLALAALSKVHPDYQTDLAYIHTQIAKCYAQLGIQKVFADGLGTLDELLASQVLNHPRLNQFTFHLNQAVFALDSVTVTPWVKTVRRSIADTKNFLSNKIIDKTKDFLKVVNLAQLTEESMQEAIKKVGNFLQQYQHFLVSEYQMYMLSIITFIAESLMAGADRIPSAEERIVSYQRAIALFQQAAQPLSLFALVKPAEICFNKWIAHEHVAQLSKNEKDKIANHESILEEFKQVFTNQAGGRSDYFYSLRPTQYAYALFYVHKSHLALSRLAVTEEEKAHHAKCAEACQKEFVELASASRILIEELPDAHKVNMLIAINMLAPLAARVKPEIKMQNAVIEDSKSEEKSVPVKDIHLSASSSLSVSKALAAKRKSAVLESKSKSAVSSDSDSDSDSDDEINNALRDFSKKMQARRLQDKAAQNPAKKAMTKHSGSASSGAFFHAAKSSSEHWYTDANILSVLDRRLRAEVDRGEVLVFGCLESSKIFSQIKTRCAAQQLQLNNGVQQVARHFIVPVNINCDHWLALSVNFLRGFNQPPVVHYADPMQLSIPSQFKMQFLANFPAAELRGPGVVYQNHANDCGPWVVAISEHLAKTGSFINRSGVNMAEQRAADFLYFDQQNINSISHTITRRK
jgi:tetratricopeptide (TPR) repeat protein